MLNLRKQFLLSLLTATLALPTILNSHLFACTLTLAKGSATADDRPLLMKTRDNPEVYQEYVYSDSGLYAYIGVTNAGVTDQIWGGINQTGFSIVNANAYNFEDTIPGPDDDGYIMQLALSTCQTMDDFRSILDSTNLVGRTRPAIYGVIDALGGGAFFEAAPCEYYCYNWNDTSAAPNGYMVRSTFAYSGDSTHQAQHRHDRALALLDSAYLVEALSRQFITQSVMRDLVGVTTNPYPLPFQGLEGSLPYGFINTNTENLINRYITRAAFVVQGILPDENPLLTTLWALVAEPISTAALPLWVHAGSVPEEFDGPEIDPSTLNMRAQSIRDFLYPQEERYSALDTWRLVDQWRDGLLPFLFSLENLIFARGDSALIVWRNQALPDSAEVATFQNELASWALAEMDAWGPPQPPDINLTVLANNVIQLNWPPVTMNVFCRPMDVSSYTIYASDQPFLNRLAGDSLTTVTSPPVSLSAPETYRFFQVRCRP